MHRPWVAFLANIALFSFFPFGASGTILHIPFEKVKAHDTNGAVETALNPEILTGPTSPTRRLKLSTQMRASSMPAVPRSVPNSAVAPHPQEPWNGAYSPTSSGVDSRGSPSLADVSPVVTGPGSMHHWNQHHAPMPSPAVSDAGPHADGSGQSYGYLQMDNSGRPLSYSPAGDGMMPQYSNAGASPIVTQAGNSQMSATMPSPAYTQFPATPQSFITSPGEDPSMQDPNMHLMQQRTPVEAQPIMYSMPTSMKDD
jgi:hypothetical protein